MVARLTLTQKGAKATAGSSPAAPTRDYQIDDSVLSREEEIFVRMSPPK